MMEFKQPQDIISGRYQVLHAFALQNRALYLTNLKEQDSEKMFLVHAVELNQPLSDQKKAQLALREEHIFVPTEELIQENGMLYQAFPIQGNILGVHLFQYAPIPLEEMKGIAKQITRHLMSLYEEGQFGIVDPLNLMIDEGDRIRFIYGGSSSILPNPGTPQDEESKEAEDVLQLAKLMYHMLTKEEVDEPARINVQLLREKIKPLPIELESIMMRAFSPDPYRRPRIKEIWKWIDDTGSGKQAALMDDTLTGRSTLMSFGLEEKKPIEEVEVKQHPDLKKETRKVAAKKPLFTKQNILILVAVIAVVLAVQNFFLGSGARSIAESIIDPAIEEDPVAAEKFIEESIQADKNGDLNKAIQNALKAISANPEKPDYYLKLTNYYGAQKNYAKGIEVLTIATQIFTDDEDIYDQLATYYYFQKDYPRALEAVNKAIELNSRKANFYYHQGKIYKAQNKQKEATEAFKKVANTDSTNGDGLHELAIYSYEQGDLKSAISYEDQATKIDENEKMSQVSKGLLYLELYKQKKLEFGDKPNPDQTKELESIKNKSLYALQTGSNLDKENAEHQYLKAHAYYYFGSFMESYFAAEKAAFRDQKNAKYFYLWALSASQCHKDASPTSMCNTAKDNPTLPNKERPTNDPNAYLAIAKASAKAALDLEPNNSTFQELNKLMEALAPRPGTQITPPAPKK